MYFFLGYSSAAVHYVDLLLLTLVFSGGALMFWFVPLNWYFMGFSLRSDRLRKIWRGICVGGASCAALFAFVMYVYLILQG